MLLEEQQYVPPLTCVIQIQEGVSEKLPIILLCQATPPLGGPGGHALEGPAVGGHQSHVLTNFKNGFRQTSNSHPLQSNFGHPGPSMISR